MNSFNKSKWVQIIVLVFLFAFFFSIVNYFESAKYALIAATYNVLLIHLVYAFTIRFLFPRFYQNTSRYFIYSGIFLLVITVSLIFLEEKLIMPLGNNRQEKPPVVFHFIRLFTSFGFAFFVATSVSLMRQTARFKENEKLLTEEKLETELKLLKAQINPHFIFNALNNIYSLTYLKSENAPDSVLKLSEMLRYVFYDCSKDRVPLKNEIKYIENYASFQQMKSDYTQNIRIQTEGGIEKCMIAPMLFIPFIENAFKYSRIAELEDAFVNMSIKKEDDLLYFKIENSIPLTAKSVPGSGTGINNVKHRLKIIYSEKHDLEIKEQNDKYLVNLKLKI